MRFDVVDDVGQGDAARRVTFRHDGRPTVGPHAAEREPRAKAGGRLVPSIRIPAFVARPARQVRGARVHAASPAIDDHPATWRRTKNRHHCTARNPSGKYRSTARQRRIASFVPRMSTTGPTRFDSSADNRRRI
jgi:hypothetical protein